MNNLDLAVIELKCLILDILHQKWLEGMTEVPVPLLLEELGMDEDSNLTGLDPNDTIELTAKALHDIESTKMKMRNSMMH
jgi:hypothetical protein